MSIPPPPHRPGLALKARSTPVYTVTYYNGEDICEIAHYSYRNDAAAHVRALPSEAKPSILEQEVYEEQPTILAMGGRPFQVWGSISGVDSHMKWRSQPYAAVDPHTPHIQTWRVDTAKDHFTWAGWAMNPMDAKDRATRHVRARLQVEAEFKL